MNKNELEDRLENTFKQNTILINKNDRLKADLSTTKTLLRELYSIIKVTVSPFFKETHKDLFGEIEQVLKGE